MKPIVSPYLLRWTFEQMAQLERYSKASASGPIAIAEREISPALWDAYSIAMAQYLPAPLEVPVAYAAEHDGGPWWHLCSQLEVVQVPGGHHGCLTMASRNCWLIICGKGLTFTPARLGH